MRGKLLASSVVFGSSFQLGEARLVVAKHSDSTAERIIRHQEMQFSRRISSTLQKWNANQVQAAKS
jgi:tRNA(Arg) A34 adenosine deaminase TadA